MRQTTPARDRMDAILARLHDGGSVAVADLAKAFTVSDMTIRRDLAELERDGLLERVHGGARRPPAGPLRLVDDVEPEFDARASLNGAAKAAIADEAALLVANTRTIAVDVGTTTLLAAEALLDRAAGAGASAGAGARRIFTNSLRVAARAAAEADCEVYTPGGRIRRGELSVTGPNAIAEFGALWFDVALIGVSGVTEDGFYDYSIEDTEIKRVFLGRSAHRIVLCDATKFRRVSTVRIAALDAATVLVADRQPPASLLAALRGAGVDLRVAGASSPTPSKG